MDRKTFKVSSTLGIQYTVRGTAGLSGDLYRPVGGGPHPAIVSIHGGGWDQGSRATHGEWGMYLARAGFALFATDRRHFPAEEPAFPGVIHDLRAAVRYVRSHAVSLNIDPERIAVMGDSSGGYIAALTGLLGDAPLAQDPQPGAPAVSCEIKSIIAFYGVFDLIAEWNFEQLARPLDRTAEKLIGVPLVDDRRRYFDASPVAYATRDRSHISFFLAWGTGDDVVSERLHSSAFANVLSQANFNVQTLILPDAQHYWATAPMLEEGSRSGFVAPRLLRFLERHL
jgi:acetyl esterase/lipase